MYGKGAVRQIGLFEGIGFCRLETREGPMLQPLSKGSQETELLPPGGPESFSFTRYRQQSALLSLLIDMFISSQKCLHSTSKLVFDQKSGPLALPA